MGNQFLLLYNIFYKKKERDMGLPNKNIFKIGYKIKAFRKANKLTQEELADKMNCNFKTIGNIENDRTMPDLKQVINLCDILNVSMDELFAETLSKTKKPIEPSEKEDDYPKLVNRNVSSLSANQLLRIEALLIKIRDMSEKELNIMEVVADSLIKNR